MPDLSAADVRARIRASTVTLPPPPPKPRFTMHDWSFPLFQQAHRYKVLYGGRGGGKALYVDTPIPTPDGWTTMGALVIGDRVLDEQGRPCTVTGVYPQRKKPLWRVSVRHGEDILADGEHLWTTITHAQRKRTLRKGRSPFTDWEKRSPITTREIAASLTHGKRQDVNHAIPLARAFDLPARDLPIPPYVLGCWLGDGISREAALTAQPDDAAYYRARFAQEGEVLHDPRPATADLSAPTYAISKTRSGRSSPESLIARLRLLGVLNAKHVPSIYLRASRSQRLALLRGLIDTDGTIRARGGSAIFTTMNARLARNVQELVLSLGVRPTMREKTARIDGRTIGPVWDVEFVAHIDGAPVASLPRKIARVRPRQTQQTRDQQWMITDVQPTDTTGECVCITVDSSSQLFLAGRSMIPTHNSWAIAMALILIALERPVRVACVREVQKSIAESSKATIEKSIERMGLRAHFRIQKDAIHGINGSYFFFRGLSTVTEESIRGWEAVDIVWVEEAHRMSKRSREILYPTIRKSGSEIWFSFNPRYRNDPVWQDFCSSKSRVENAFVIKVNYKDNSYFPPELESERALCYANERDRYAHIWLGDPDDEGETRKVLPYRLISQCIGALRDGKLELEKHDGTKILLDVTTAPFQGRYDGGLDIADLGADKNALVFRKGPRIVSAESWHGNSLGETTRRMHSEAIQRGARRMYYDVGGVGAGVRSHLKDMGARPYTAEPIQFGGAVTGDDVEFALEVTNRDFFAHRNSQLGWALRLRAQQTDRLLRGDENVDLGKCLFIDGNIPDVEEFVTQLAQPEWSETANGKLRIEKQPDGAASPDLYDSAILSFGWDSRDGLVAR